jgi:hypothetical protein
MKKRVDPDSWKTGIAVTAALPVATQNDLNLTDGIGQTEGPCIFKLKQQVPVKH